MTLIGHGQKLNPSIPSVGSLLRSRSSINQAEVKEGNESSDASNSRSHLYHAGSPFQVQIPLFLKPYLSLSQQQFAMHLVYVTSICYVKLPDTIMTASQ